MGRGGGSGLGEETSYWGETSSVNTVGVGIWRRGRGTTVGRRKKVREIFGEKAVLAERASLAKLQPKEARAGSFRLRRFSPSLLLRRKERKKGRPAGEGASEQGLRKGKKGSSSKDALLLPAEHYPPSRPEEARRKFGERERQNGVERQLL